MFAQAMNNSGLTENGMPTPISSLSAVVDLFFKMGASRKAEEDAIIALFSAAWAENPLMALKELFLCRDIRGGQGERRFFRVAYRWLVHRDFYTALENMHLIPEYGRWDDVLAVSHGTALQGYGFGIYADAIRDGNGLACKYAPREGHAHSDWYKGLRAALKMSAKEYRQTIVAGTQVVETLMCKQKWDEVDYAHIPSKAVHQYRKAWERHDEERYKAWLSAVERGESKINAKAIFPHEILRPYLRPFIDSSKRPDAGSAEERQIIVQWEALVARVQLARILSFCDVSGSMTWEGGEPFEVAVALSLLTAEKATGAFHNLVCTFESVPRFFQLKSEKIVDRVREMAHMGVGGSTNLEALFRMVLQHCREGNVPQEEMFETLIIFSDMQFNSCTISPSDSAFNIIKRMYAEAGYTMPRLVFWNLRASNGVPVEYNTQGVALVSGYSPAMLQFVTSKDMNPIHIVEEAINKPRYAPIRVHSTLE